MKKIALITLVLIFLVVSAVACTGSGEFFEEYFNTYASTPAYTVATESLNLSAGVKIAEYFGNGYFTIEKEASSITSFGIATKDYVIIEPETTDTGYFEYVVDISNNYAIMVKRIRQADGSLVARLGAVYLAGENRSTDIVGFNYYVNTDYSKLQENQCAIRIVGDYIAVIGDVESNRLNPLDTEAKLKSKDYFTFYQYNEEEGKLQECFRVKASSTASSVTQVTISTVFDEVDGYVIRTDDYNSTYNAAFSIYYYRLRDIDEEGYVDFFYKYQPYSVDGVKALCDLSSSASHYYDIASYYLGNGIFLQKAAFYADDIYNGYQMIVSPSESPLGVKSYAVMKSDRVNLTGSSPKTYTNNNVFPYEVVNQYNDREMRSLVDYYNGSPVIATETGDSPIYQYPYYATSSIVTNGYSIVYTHYFPDLGNEEATADEQKTAPVTYILYNNNDLKEMVIIDSTLMPTVFIDGVGLETYSIDFDQTLDFVTELFSLSNESTTLQTSVITETEFKQYRAYTYHNGYVTAGELDLNNTTQDDFKLGAFSYDGKEVKQVVPYKYDELTPFFGSYATAAIWDKTNKTKAFYRVDANGQESVISNGYALHNGCYVTRLLQADGSYLYALWANDGTSLIQYDGVTGIKVLEEFLTADGYFVETTVIVTKDGHDMLYKLS